MERFSARAFLTLALASLASIVALAAPTRAEADTTVIVLGVRSLDGDDEFARNLTGVVRHAAEQVNGWDVSPREVSLAQMIIANGCDDSDAACLGLIARGLRVQRIIFGTVRRSTASGEYNFEVSLGLYNAETSTIEHTVTDSLPRTRIDVDDLRSPARRYAAVLAGQPEVGSLLIRAPQIARVAVDGNPITQTNGQFVVQQLSVGPHTVEVSAPNRQPYRQDVTIAIGEQSVVTATLVPNVTPGERTPNSPRESRMTMPSDRNTPHGEGIPDLPEEQAPPSPPSRGHGGQFWIGAITLGAGVALLGVTVYSWARLSTLNSDPEFSMYRDTPRAAANAADVCDAAQAGDMTGTSAEGLAHIQSLCSEGGTLNILQYVFLAASAAGIGIGTYLMVTDEGNPDQAPSEPSISLSPSVTRHGASLGATLRF